MHEIFKELRQRLKSEVCFDAITRRIYSVDASIYEVEPLGIVIPQSIDELVLTLQIAERHGVPVTPRGAATGITGSCLGKGLIIDTSQYLNRILEINTQEEYVICEPGVVQDDLNRALAPHGYRLGPDTSTGNRATLGGMLANNSAGARSLRYGRMVDHVEMVQIAVAGGSLITFEALNSDEWNRKKLQGTFESDIYKVVEQIQHRYGKEIAKHFPKIPKHVSGYNLDLINKTPINISQLIAGSEGTLGIATKIKMKIAKKPIVTGICVIHIADMIVGMQSIASMLKHQPLALEMIDDKILEMGRRSPAVQNKMGWLVGNPQAVFVAEFDGDTPDEVHRKLAHFSEAMKTEKLGYSHVILTDPVQIGYVWEVRKAGLGLLLSKRSYSRAIAFIEDLSIAPEKLASFMEEFTVYLKQIGKEAGIYGHIGSGCMHIRPYIDLRQEDELAAMRKMMDAVSTMVLKHGGAMSGEHGDGLIRSWLNEKMFGPEVYTAFKMLKHAFDPKNLMNPGKIVGGPPLTQDLRTDPQTTFIPIPTFLDFSREGGFELAADLCNGNGQCRKGENVMCPSFQATKNEYDTTRARAQALRGIIHGKLPLSELTENGVYDVLDLCLECKGCKRECPSQVDMAKMKSEVLYQYQEKNGYSLRSRIFGNLHRLNRAASPFAKIFNYVVSTWLSKRILSWIGIAPERSLPALAEERFSVWFNKQQQQKHGKSVVLFNDTYTEFNQPEIGQATYKILQQLGYNVILATEGCCGRPLISKGLLKQAKSHANNLIDKLYAYSEQNLSIIGLEPSCTSAIRDDYRGLLGNDKEAARKLEKVISSCFSLDEFLQKHLVAGKLPLPCKGTKRKVLMHGHCHQKALVTTFPTIEVLRGIEGFDVEEIPSGCCGVAGSFGYEKEHYHLSMQIGELHLLPAVRSASKDTIIVASGISCRSQISHGSDKPPLHLAEAIILHFSQI